MGISDFIGKAEKRKVKKKTSSERDIESAFVKYTKDSGCRAFKLVLLNTRGFPDRTVMCPGGRLFFVEFKKKDKVLSAPQLTIRKLLESLGFEYHVCDERGQAENVLDEFLLN